MKSPHSPQVWLAYLASSSSCRERTHRTPAAPGTPRGQNDGPGSRGGRSCSSSQRTPQLVRPSWDPEQECVLEETLPRHMASPWGVGPGPPAGWDLPSHPPSPRAPSSLPGGACCWLEVPTGAPALSPQPWPPLPAPRPQPHQEAVGLEVCARTPAPSPSPPAPSPHPHPRPRPHQEAVVLVPHEDQAQLGRHLQIAVAVLDEDPRLAEGQLNSAGRGPG